LKKAAATAKDVLECATVDADLQNAAIKGAQQQRSKIIALTLRESANH